MILILMASFAVPALAKTVSPAGPDSERMGNEESPELCQIAILLDSSGSMEGLVDQARIQIWSVVDQIARVTRNERPVQLEIAVFQYGNTQDQESRGFVKKILGFSDDLDEVSRALFSITLKGGDEYCGEAIRQACDDLQWNPSAAYKTVFIAGNESFDQGNTSFASVFPRLSEKSILLNTVYCQWKKAEPDEDVRWELSARLGGGTYLAIDHNHNVRDMETPFDGQFRELNRRMNDSFVWYGPDGDKHRRNQLRQDKNAEKMSATAMASRMSSKIGHLYHHVHSDLVDAMQHDVVDMATLPESKMPERLRQMTAEERAEYMEEKIAQREQVRREMATLIAKRNRWLQQQPGQDGSRQSWGSALEQAIAQQLADRGFDTANMDR